MILKPARISIGRTGERRMGIEVKVLTKTAPAHGVYDINSVAWCPRKGLESYLASCGDDGSVKVTMEGAG